MDDLTAKTRAELNELAAAAGVAEPEKLRDKPSVIAAIEAAQAAADAGEPTTPEPAAKDAAAGDGDTSETESPTVEQPKVKAKVADGPKHLDGCPAERLERYSATGPKGKVEIVRCIDCGASTPSGGPVGARDREDS